MPLWADGPILSHVLVDEKEGPNSGDLYINNYMDSIPISFKWPKRAVNRSFFSGNIANIIPGSPLKKMIPLMENHGECMGTPVGLWTIYMYLLNRACYDQSIYITHIISLI